MYSIYELDCEERLAPPQGNERPDKCPQVSDSFEI